MGWACTQDIRAARAQALQAARRGSGAACLQLGVMHATGQQVRQNYAAAARWYARAAHDVLDGPYSLAFLYFRGLGVPADADKAVALLEAAAARGSAEAAWALHRQYAHGEYLQQDPATALHWLLRAAQLGSVVAACTLAQTLGSKDALAPPRETVVELLEKCANRGDADAQNVPGLAALQLRGARYQQGAAVVFSRRERR